MKKIILVLSFLVFTSPAHAVIYKWVDQKGALNFTDDYARVPPGYRDSVEEVNMQSPVVSQKTVNTPSGQTAARKAPPVEQALVREGFFATKLAEALRVGQPASEAEAESMLASVGVAPKNGWIADYPLTPDIVVELQSAVGEAADAGRLSIRREEATRAYQDLMSQQGLPVRADNGGQNADVEPPQDYNEYSNPEAINDYYSDQGPPVVTYYAPPQDYSYLYSWVPYSFWCSGFWFPGFFILHDFHRNVFHHGKWAKLTNHVTDPRTNRVSRIDPVTRGIAKHQPHASGGLTGRGFASPEAHRDASSILTHSQEQIKPAMTPGTKPEPYKGAVPQRRSDASTFRGSVAQGRPPTVNHWTGRSQPAFGHPSTVAGSFSPRSSFGSAGGRSFARSFGSSMGRSFSGGFHGGGGGGHR